LTPLYYFIVETPVLDNMVISYVGFAPMRSLPTVQYTTLSQCARKQPLQKRQRKVYLFSDEFTEYNDTAIGIKAYDLLTALGYQVIIPILVDSARTYLTKGFV